MLHSQYHSRVSVHESLRSERITHQKRTKHSPQEQRDYLRSCRVHGAHKHFTAASLVHRKRT